MANKETIFEGGGVCMFCLGDHRGILKSILYLIKCNARAALHWPRQEARRNKQQSRVNRFLWLILKYPFENKRTTYLKIINYESERLFLRRILGSSSLYFTFTSGTFQRSIRIGRKICLNHFNHFKCQYQSPCATKI